MGKSPGKWIKAVIFGKKSSKSSLSKDANSEKKTSITINSQSNDIADSTVISSPVCHVSNINGEHTPLENSSSVNLINTANGEELIRLDQAVTKVQATFRGYLARRAFWALKGIIRLQAVMRGHIVRRQAVATLHSMRAIVDLQGVVRGQIVRLSRSFPQKGSLVQHVEKDLIETSLKSERLSTNAFAVKLVASTKTTIPLTINYNPSESNSVASWLSRWSSSHFWDPLPPPKKTNPKRTIRNLPQHTNNPNDKENQKARRRKSFPAKQESHVPSYMAATESAKAKLRAHMAEGGGDDGVFRRHSTGKLGKNNNNNNKSQISPTDEKRDSGGWKRF